MTPLRQSMIEAMQLRGFSPRTQESYLSAVEQLARYTHRPPDQLSLAQLQAFFKYLALERELSAASCRLYLNGVRFFYLHVLEWRHFDVPLVVPKREQRIPELLTRDEVARLLAACTHPKHRMLLSLCYGCGLRVSEVVAVRVRDIDGERSLLRIEQGKGAKDRLVIISPALLEALRRYWHAQHPGEWLFPNNRRMAQHLGVLIPASALPRGLGAIGSPELELYGRSIRTDATASRQVGGQTHQVSLERVDALGMSLNWRF